MNALCENSYMKYKRIKLYQQESPSNIYNQELRCVVMNKHFLFFRRIQIRDTQT